MFSYGDLVETPLSDNQKSLRERAHGTLGTLLTQTFTTPYPDRKRSPAHSSPLQGTSSGLDSQRPDYNSAVYRLKSLLKVEEKKKNYQRNDESKRTSFTTKPQWKHDSTTPMVTSTANRGQEPQSEDLILLINHQSSYIQQLEGAHTFCKEELVALKGKTDEVLRENMRLHEELKTNVVQLALELRQFPQENEKDSQQPDLAHTVDPEQPMNKELYATWEKELEKVKLFHDTKTQHLESQLSYTRVELKKFETICEDLKSKLRMSESLSLLGRDEEPIAQGMCIRCAQHEAVLVATHVDGKAQMLQSLTKERDNLMNMVTNIKSTMAELREKESAAYTQVKQSLEMVEEAQLEKTQALVQREQLHEDLNNSQQRMSEMIADQQSKLLAERELTRRECQHELEQLQQKVAQEILEHAAVKNQLERVTRDKVAMETELEQSKNQIKLHTRDITQVAHNAKISTVSSTVQRDEALRQLATVRQATALQIQDLLQEKARLKTELADVKRRMENAEQQAIVSKDESIKLTERCNTTERELMLAKMAKDGIDRSRNDEVRTLTHRTQQREQQLQQVIYELENKHSSSVCELESVICSQGSLINKLRDEGLNLTEKLQEVSDKYRSEMRRLKQMNTELTMRCHRLSQQHAEMEAQCVNHSRLHKRMTLRIEQMDEHGQRSGQQVYELLQKQTSILKERQALSKEVEFLRSQIQKTSPESIPSFSTTDHVPSRSYEMDGSIY